MPNEQPKSKYEITVDLIRGMVWPLVVLGILVTFWNPFHQVADKLPALVDKSDSISIGSLSLSVNRSIQTKADDDVRKVLASLNANEVQAVLNMNDEGEWYSGQTDGPVLKQRHQSLIDQGVFEIIEDPKIIGKDNSGKPFTAEIKLTALGKKTKGFLQAVIDGFVDELRRADRAAAKKSG
jgi:hypothetical protein